MVWPDCRSRSSRKRSLSNIRDDTGNISEALYQVRGLGTSVFITAGGEIAPRQIGQMTGVQTENFGHQLVTGEAIKQ